MGDVVESSASSAASSAPAYDPFAAMDSSQPSTATDLPAPTKPASKVEALDAVTLSFPPPKPAAAATSPPAAAGGSQPTVHQAVNLAPVTLAAPVAAPVVAAAPARALKPYKVGEFKAIESGTKNQLEISDCDCDIGLLKVRIEENGQNVVFKRQEQHQRFALPYSLSLDRIHVTYDKNRDGGTLTLVLTKPGGGIPTNITGEFTKFTIPLDPSAADGSKVSMSAGQTAAFFQFKPQGASKYETEIVGELINGRDVKFHATITQTDKGTRTKSTQTFTLPNQVALDYIQVGAGHEVKVFTKKPDGAGGSAPAVADADVTIHAL